MKSIRNDNFTAIVLAGGQSRRMGTNKALITYKGKKLIEYPISLARHFTTKVIVSTNTHSLDYLGLTVCRDILPVKAAIAGIHAGLRTSATEWSLVLTCDMPNTPPWLVEQMIKQLGSGARIVVPYYGGYPEPLCGFYHRSLTGSIEHNVEAGRLSLLDLMAVVKHDLVIPENADLIEAHEVFKNINTPRDLAGSTD
jgi:molybdopterin-guanine dinucleotide biosynthesis protein A